MARIISAAGLALVKAYEGLRLEAYQDTSGVWTIGYGHAAGVKPGDRISAERAEVLLEIDLMAAEQAVTRLVQVPLSDGQFSALVSFVFNEGEGAFAQSRWMKLVSDARHWWRWWSLRILAVAAALQAEIVLFPDALKGWLPDAWMHGIALGLLLTGAGARLVRQEPPQ